MFIRPNSLSPPTLTRTGIALESRDPSSEAGLDKLMPQSSSLSLEERQFHQMGRQFLATSARVEEFSGTQVDSVEIQSTFPGREGYDQKFLGVDLALPKVDASIRDQLAPLLSDPTKSELEYTNFSIVMNKERKQAMFTAVNIDGAKIVSVPRKGKWTIDARIARDHQLGNEAYSNNSIDRGHMVRRRDPVWGEDPMRASNDTFAYTNAGLQHGSLNQKTWLDLENHILEQATSKGQKLTVLTGPVFADDDPLFDNKGKISQPVQMPKEFWKVVVWNDDEEGLKSAAFIQSQKDYMGRSAAESDFDSAEMGVYQVPLAQLEKLTKLDFGELKDTVGQVEQITRAHDAVLA